MGVEFCQRRFFLSIILEEQTFRIGPDWFFSIRVSVQLTLTKKTLNKTRLKTGKKYVSPENRFLRKSLKWRPFLQECVYWGSGGSEVYSLQLSILKETTKIKKTKIKSHNVRHR